LRPSFAKLINKLQTNPQPNPTQLLIYVRISPGWRGGPPEAPPEGPAGGALGGSRWRRPAGGTCSRDLASLELKNTSKSFLDHFFKEIWWYTD